MSGVARGVEGASEYAVDERGNPFWTYSSPAGPLEITINLAKPEKDPRDIAAAAGATLGGAALEATPAGEGEAAATTVEGDARKGAPSVPTTCDLCWEASGEDGPAHLRRSGAPVTEIALGRRALGLVVLSLRLLPRAPHRGVARAPPHGHRSRHDRSAARFLGRLPAVVHRFQRRSAHCRRFPSGARPLPRRRPPLPIDECAIARAFSIEGLESVEAGIVRWPASVVRLRSCDRRLLAEAACRVLDAWRPFSFEECDIRAFSLVPDDGREGAVSASGALASPARFVQHNTANPILWREGDDYVMDLVLRNNRTTPEHPFGLFHVPERLFHIKKENIGLIEIMGRAILPARLAAELPAIKDECSRAFYEILVATGVFKDDAAGRRGWEAFLATI